MTVLEVGQKAPLFETLTDQGEKISLEGLKGKKIVLYFYPKDNTPGCTTQACSFRDTYPDFEKLSAIVLGVSPDGLESHQKFKKEQGLPFLLLMDEDNNIAEKYGVWGEKNMYGKKYMGIVRSQFVINEDGILLDVKYKISPKDSVLRALQALSS